MGPALATPHLVMVTHLHVEAAPSSLLPTASGGGHLHLEILGWLYTIAFFGLCNSIAFYRTIPYRTPQYLTELYRTVQYRTVRYSILPYCIVPYLTVPYFTIARLKRQDYRYSAVHMLTIRYNALRIIINPCVHLQKTHLCCGRSAIIPCAGSF